ncbi:MAG: hypothetical protein CMJ81_18395 [Planctomycetaceae bacterium]|nr:hypothetical protein [Planctomycetaceae bacterium]
MRKSLLLAGGLLLLVGCSQGLPRAGDTVMPRLVRSLSLMAGEKSELWVELTAKADSGPSRRLGFSASPHEDPVATLAFYNAQGGLVGEEEVHLSLRC